MRAVDTGVLVRLIIRDNSRQASVAGAWVELGTWGFQACLGWDCVGGFGSLASVTELSTSPNEQRGFSVTKRRRKKLLQHD